VRAASGSEADGSLDDVIDVRARLRLLSLAVLAVVVIEVSQE
jgi:hypothetical protein